jgi:hypothetical protein
LGFLESGEEVVVVEGCKLGIPLGGVAACLQAAYAEMKQHVLMEQQWATLVCMLLQPECHTALNRRKLLVQQSVLEPHEELRWITLAQTWKRHAKSSTLWHHRSVILSHTTVNLSEELQQCLQAANRYPCNYHAWNYRRLLLLSYWDDPATLTQEYHTVIKWTNMHVADTSGWHHRLVLAHHLHQIDQESARIQQLILDYPGHAVLQHALYTVTTSEAGLSVLSTLPSVTPNTECTPPYDPI